MSNRCIYACTHTDTTHSMYARTVGVRLAGNDVTCARSHVDAVSDAVGDVRKCTHTHTHMRTHSPGSLPTDARADASLAKPSDGDDTAMASDDVSTGVVVCVDDDSVCAVSLLVFAGKSTASALARVASCRARRHDGTGSASVDANADAATEGDDTTASAPVCVCESMRVRTSHTYISE
jgi:hypothetical protein